MEHNTHHGHKWSSKFGFIMAAVGSAVGLGNIWRFPYITGQHGGAIFLIVYLIMAVILGFMIMSAELALGRYSGRSVVDTFKRGKKNWSFIGFISILICFFIVSYYSVIGGWITKYLFGYLTGGNFVSSGDYTNVFNSFITKGWEPALFNFLFLSASVLILVFGVKKGIEKVSKILMPALFVMLVFVAIVALTMPGAIEGVKFFLVPDFEAVKENGGILAIISTAMGQVFFSLSVGIGINCTYGSYLTKETNIPKDSITVCGFDTLVAVVAGFAILPAVFSAGIAPSEGPGLIFSSLPAVFNQLGGWFGNLVGFVFFLLVLVAAVTSCISLLEVMIATVEQKLKLKRIWATLIVGGIVLISSTLVSFSQDGRFGINLLDLFDTTTVNYLMPLTALSMCLFVGIVWGINNAAIEVTNNRLEDNKWIGIWKVFVKFICPMLVLAIFIVGLVDETWNKTAFSAIGVSIASIALAVIFGLIYNKYGVQKNPMELVKGMDISSKEESQGDVSNNNGNVNEQ